MKTPKTEKVAPFAFVDGVEGPCLVMNDKRIAGPKPWGGGRIIKEWTVSNREIRAQLKFSKRKPTQSK